MTAHRGLAIMRGIDEASVKEINKIHDKLDSVLASAAEIGFSTATYSYIEDLELSLQSLWKFPEDIGYHRYKHIYKFKCQWARRVFQCIATGELLTIPDDVKERACYFWGNGAMIDVGRLDCYSRNSGCKEVV
jgi:hypothetical protein